MKILNYLLSEGYDVNYSEIIVIYAKRGNRKKDIGVILLGFATLMFGMETMSDAVAFLRDQDWFQQLFIMFENPFLGVIVGAILTAVVQSSSASVGILQVLSDTGSVTMAASIPIIMGQNIGTCVTALISSIGTNKNARRTAIVHLSFNVIGTLVWLTVFAIISSIFELEILTNSASRLSISIIHTIFNVLCTALLLPMSSLLEKLAVKLVPDGSEKQVVAELDERLLATPSVALERCNSIVMEMAKEAVTSFKSSLNMLTEYSPEEAESIRYSEDKTDHYEDILGTYLIKLSAHQLSDADNTRVSKLLKAIGDFERISDHSVNVLESVEELREKKMEFTPDAKKELDAICSAVSDILSITYNAFINNDIETAYKVEPLEEVIDELRNKLRDGHITRLKTSECSVEAGFVWLDLLTNLERTADHCSNIAVTIIDSASNNMNIHESVKNIKKGSHDFEKLYEEYLDKYMLV